MRFDCLLPGGAVRAMTLREYRDLRHSRVPAWTFPHEWHVVVTGGLRESGPA
jgi:hypothetical protein